MMCIRTLAAAAVLASIAISAEAQSQFADERAIRDLIARYDKGESVTRTDDEIFWTGEFKRPTVGSQKREALPADQRPSSARVPGSPSERVPGSRRRVTTPVRIEIAKSGDLAYEFSNSELSFSMHLGSSNLNLHQRSITCKNSSVYALVAVYFWRGYVVFYPAR